MPYKKKKHSLLPGAYGIFDEQDSLVCLTLNEETTEFMLLVLNDREAPNEQTLDAEQNPKAPEANSEGSA